MISKNKSKTTQKLKLVNCIDMEVDTKNLPDNLNICHQIILELLATINNLGSEVEVLKNRLNTLLRNSYGTKSEKFDPNQLALFAYLLNDVKQAQQEEQSKPKAKRKGHRPPKPSTQSST